MKNRRRYLRMRDRMVIELFEKYYEPERLDRSKRWVYYTKILPQIPMSERTFYRILERRRERLNELSKEDSNERTEEVD